MTDLPKKKIKMVAKDPSGGLVQAMPKTKAEYVSCGDESLKDALDPLPLKDVKEMQVELEPHSRTVTDEYYNAHEGILMQSPGRIGNTLQVSFSIYFYGNYANSSSSYSLNIRNSIHNTNDVWLGYFYDETGTQLCKSSKYFNDGTLSVPSNTPCYYDFEIPSNVVISQLDASISGCTFYDEYGNAEPYGDSLFIKGYQNGMPSEYLELEYDSNAYWNINFTLPTIGNSKTLYFNSWQDFTNDIHASSEYSFYLIDKENRNKSLTIENINGTDYRLCFLWSTAEHRSETTTTNWKNLKTTLELNDGTKKTAVRPISGILQKVDCSTVYDVVPSGNVTFPERNGSFEASLIIGDGTDASETDAGLMLELNNNMWPYRNIDPYGAMSEPAVGHWYKRSTGM